MKKNAFGNENALVLTSEDTKLNANVVELKYIFCYALGQLIENENGGF